jgi:TetR/AcrR family transcriptional repressor of nem operon
MKDTKEHILKVASGLFLQKSFKEVTMQEIVAKTGMSKGAFYHYFESKEQLFLEVVNDFVSAFMVDFSKLSRESLHQFYHDYLKFEVDFSFPQSRIDGDNGFNYYALIFDALKLFPKFREKAVEALPAELQAWEEIIGIARDNGEIHSGMTNERIASLFVYTSDGVGMRAVMQGNMEEKTKSVLAVWDGLYEDLKA